jgi:hypothetical protein
VKSPRNLILGHSGQRMLRKRIARESDNWLQLSLFLCQAGTRLALVVVRCEGLVLKFSDKVN